MKSAWPLDTDLTARLTGLGVSLPAGVTAQDFIDSAVEQWESETGWSPFLEVASGTFSVDPSTRNIVRLPCGFTEITVISWSGTAYTIGTDVFLLPVGARDRNKPFSALEFAQVVSQSSWDVGGISITGKRGYDDAIPTSVWNAVLGKAVADALMVIQNAPGSVKRVKQDSVEVEFLSGSEQDLISRMQSDFEKQVANYRRY